MKRHWNLGWVVLLAGCGTDTSPPPPPSDTVTCTETDLAVVVTAGQAENKYKEAPKPRFGSKAYNAAAEQRAVDVGPIQFLSRPHSSLLSDIERPETFAAANARWIRRAQARLRKEN